MPRRPAFVWLACLGFFLLSVTLVASDSTLDPVGEPKKFKKSKKPVYGVWYDNGVWFIQTSSIKGNRDSFRGKVLIKGDRFYGEFQGLETTRKVENADWIHALPGARGFEFQLSTGAKTDTLQFKPGPKATEVNFSFSTGLDSNPKNIFIGKKGEHPEKTEFTLPAHPGK